MTEYGYGDEFDDTDEAPKKDPVRARLNDLEKQNKKLEQALAERDKKLNEFLVRDVLNERGLTDKRNRDRAARWMRADGIDLADNSAVDGWLTENGDAFGYVKETPPPPQHEAAREGLNRMRAAEENGIPTGSEAEILAEIANAQTSEELALIQAKYSHLRL